MQEPYTDKIFQDVLKVYDTEPCARTFDEDLCAHLRNGFVFSRPDLFLMGRPVCSTGRVADIVNPWYRFNSADCDCWHVYLCAGNIVRALEYMPWPLQHVSFERKNVLRFWPYTRIDAVARALKLCGKQT